MTSGFISGAPPILFVALQTGAGANGGIASLGEIMLSLTRYRPVLLTNRHSEVTNRWQAAGVEVYVAPEFASQGWRRAPIRSAHSYASYFRHVFGLLRQTGARIVHANDPLAFQLCLAPVAAMRGSRIVLNIRDTLDPDRPAPKQRYRWLFSRADHVLFLSQDMRRRWSAIVPEVEARSSATYSIVDLARFAPSPLPHEQPRVVLVSGVVSPKKGQLVYLREIAPILASRGIESWLSGDFDPAPGTYAEQCRKAAEPLGEMVRFLGYRQDMPALLARAHVLCVMSHYEGLMRSMIEAMTMGRPVVSTQVASAREMLEHPDMPAGAVFPIGGSAEMAEAIWRLCEDEDRNRTLGSNGTEMASRYFSRAAVTGCYEAAYDSLRGKGSQRA